MCVTLVIYQESLHDARSTKYKMEYFNHQLECQEIVSVIMRRAESS